MKSNIFKIYEEKQKGRTKTIDGYRSYSFKFTTKDLIYECDNIKSALDMWNRLTEENYRPHMCLLVDYGLQSEEQYRHNKFNWTNTAATRSNYDDIIPYVILVEYHNSEIVENTLELHVQNGQYDHIFREKGMQNIIDALTFFSKVWDDKRYSYVMEEHDVISDEETGKMFKRVRTVASSKLLKRQEEYRGCEKIRRYVAVQMNDIEDIDDFNEIEKVTDGSTYRDHFKMHTVGEPCRVNDRLTLL